jgi:hypothetical protein
MLVAMRASRWRGHLVLVGGLAAVFVPMAMLRLVDGDEGTYLLVARRVMEGALPFHDIFYPQMFLLPYLYGAWMEAVGYSWYAGRALSALLTVALGWLLHAEVRRLTGRTALAWLAAASLALNSLALGWFPLVKTYPAATLLLMAAVAALMRDGPAARPLLAGLLLGLAIDIRLYLACLVPVFALHAALEAPPGAGARRAGRLGLGLGLGLAPNALFIAIDPGRWAFNIAGVHGIRSDWGYVGALGQKLHVVATLLGLAPIEPLVALQFVALLVLNGGLLLAAVRAGRRPPLSLSLAAGLLAVGLGPTPTFVQYAVMAVPLLILNAVLFLARLDEVLRPHHHPLAARAARAALVAAGCGYALVAPFEVHRYVASGADIQGMGMAPGPENWRIPVIRAVGRALDAAAGPGGPPALSWWPGYFVETRTRILPRMENHFTVEFARKLTPEQVVRYRFMTDAELEAAIRERAVPVVAVGNWLGYAARARHRRQLADAGYARVGAVADTEIFRWPPAPGPAAGALPGR